MELVPLYQIEYAKIQTDPYMNYLAWRIKKIPLTFMGVWNGSNYEAAEQNLFDLWDNQIETRFPHYHRFLINQLRDLKIHSSHDLFKYEYMYQK